MTGAGPALALPQGASKTPHGCKVRAPGQYWSAEGFALDLGRLAALDIEDVSVVVTHTAPHDVAPVAFTPIVWQFVPGDPLLLDDLREERRQIARLRDEILRRTTPRLWCYGHFHTSARASRLAGLHIARHSGNVSLFIRYVSLSYPPYCTPHSHLRRRMSCPMRYATR